MDMKTKSRPIGMYISCTSNAQVYNKLLSAIHHISIRSNRDLTFEENHYEEADITMICLASEASQQCPNAKLVFFTPLTNVLVLSIRHYEKLCKTVDTST